jgi:hypothetical protein
MTRARRRVGAPPAETAEPRRSYLVPRHRWPAAWDALSEARAAFITGLAMPAPDPDQAAPIEVLVAERGAAILERLRHQAAAERTRHDAATADAFEVALQREAQRIRDGNRAGAEVLAEAFGGAE